MLSFKRKAKTFKYKIEGTEAAGRFRARRLLGGIKWRIFRHFMLFSLIMLVLLWLAQTVFLDTIYKQVKTNDMRRVSLEISQSLQNDGFESDELSDVMYAVARNNYMCVLVAKLAPDAGLNLRAQSVDVNAICIIHELNAGEVLVLAAEAAKNEGSVFYELDFGPGIHENSELAQLLGNRFRYLTRFYQLNYDIPTMLLSVRLVDTETDGQYVVLINGNIAPLDATVSTLRLQLVLLTGVMMLLDFIMALVVAGHISRPIIHISKLSRRLAQGDFELDFSVPKADLEISELAETLNYAAVELAKTEQLQRDLIANISHDLRTPLTLITAYGEAMRDLPGENTPENVQVIIDETERLSVLVNDLLDMSKLQAGAIKLERREFELTELIESIIVRFNKLMATEGYTIDFVPAARLWVEADEIKLTQVIYNLINNAVTYTGPDKLVKIRQLLHRSGHGSRVRIEVIDTGEGIAPEQIKDIWRRYYKGSANHQRSRAGNGLGLAIVKNILDLHGGAYGVESTAGQGSCFWFELEVKRQEPLT